MELKNEINLIVWGFIPELNYALKKYGFTVLLQSELEVGLYERKKSKRTKEDGHITIGGLAYAAAVKVAKKYYSNKNIIVTIKEYSGYNEAIKKLDEGEIDYVVGPPSFYRGISLLFETAMKKYSCFQTLVKYLYTY